MNREEKERQRREREKARATEHISAPEIKKLYEDFPMKDHYTVLETLAPRVLASTADKLAVLQLMVHACDIIISDIGEHGQEHVDNLYEGHERSYFEEQRAKLNEQIAQLRDQGATSDSFERWKAIRNPRWT